MSSTPLFSVIIPARNSAKTLPPCLQALLHQDGYRFQEDYDLILVDDGSTDNTSQVAEAFGTQVLRQENAGPASARNRGAQASSAEYLLFTDSDCIPQADWCRQMLEPFQDSEVIGVKGAYYCREKNRIARFVQQEFEYKYDGMRQLARIDFIDTYSAAYRRSVFIENGGFEESFSLPSVEDQEFSFRLARKGYKLVFQPLARVFHSHDLSLGEYARRKWGIGYWKAFMLRWLPEKTLSDSYTPASQRWQILILLVSMLSLLLGFFWEWAWILAGFSLGIFYLSALPFLKLIWKNDRPILASALVLLILRAGVLGFGLFCGFLFPPKMNMPGRNGLKMFERAAKRAVDILGSILGLLLGAPLVLVAMLLIALDSKGRVIYSQERAGENGRPFQLYKLRTMVAGADRLAEDLPGQNAARLENLAVKTPDDPRITRIGRFLRRWSVDEIPQFWNILKGEMSLVGPRPEETWVVALYNDEQRQRLVVKPGLTGPMQISGRADLSLDARLTCELAYIKNYSFWKDIAIIWQSFAVIFSGKGAY